MNALVIRNPGEAAIEQVREPSKSNGSVLLKVRMVGLCGSDLNSFRGLNPMVSFPRIPGHEVSATILEGDFLDSRLKVGTGRKHGVTP
jgi:threonine dehydrogenase-like Zn-dependent dehydrogenase